MARRRGRSVSAEHRNKTGILLGVAGALIAALLVYQVFLKGGDDTTSSTSSAPPAAGAPAPAGATTTTTVPLQPELPNGSFDELSLRDPFEPVGGITPDGGTTVDTTPVDTTPATAPSDTLPTTVTTSPEQNPAPTTEVALLDITVVNGQNTARVRVGTVEYTVVQGQTFGPASNYVLTQFTSPTCATFTYADSPFTLCTGEQIRK
jgi:hypothetical protein